MVMQKILKGINNLGEVLKGSTKVLLVCDSSFPFLNMKDNIECMNDESFENLIYFICFLFKCDGNMEYNKYIYHLLITPLLIHLPEYYKTC